MVETRHYTVTRRHKCWAAYRRTHRPCQLAWCNRRPFGAVLYIHGMHRVNAGNGRATRKHFKPCSDYKNDKIITLMARVRGTAQRDGRPRLFYGRRTFVETLKKFVVITAAGVGWGPVWMCLLIMRTLYLRDMCLYFTPEYRPKSGWHIVSAGARELEAPTKYNSEAPCLIFKKK